MGFDDILGRPDGSFDNVGDSVGNAVGASPHSITDSHRIHTSILFTRMLPFVELFDLYPLIHLHLGRNAFISIPDASAKGSSHGTSNLK